MRIGDEVGSRFFEGLGFRVWGLGFSNAGCHSTFTLSNIGLTMSASGLNNANITWQRPRSSLDVSTWKARNPANGEAHTN